MKIEITKRYGDSAGRLSLLPIGEKNKMPKMTSQVKIAVDALRAAGFDRKDFSVEVEKLWRNIPGVPRFYEYGDAKIYMRCPKEKTISLVPALIENDLGVSYYVLKDDNNRILFLSVSARYDDRRKISIVKI
jgi:hypothetical protein